MKGGRAIAGTDACQCDSGSPPPTANPAGLTQIAYRVADFAGFRRALLTPLTGEQQLASWSPGTGDLGLQALEWWAYLGDILTFYNERIANGSYLRTAAAQPGPQPNAAALARLLGYLPTPAITATGVIAAIRNAAGPGGKLTIPADMQVTSTPTADAPAQLFEVAVTQEFTGPSDALIGLPPDPALFQPGAQASSANADTPNTVLLAGHVTVPPGEQLILVSRGWSGTTPDWAVVTAGPATAEKDPNGPGNTRLALDSADWHALAANPAADEYLLQRPTATALLWTMPTDTDTDTDDSQPASGARRRRALPTPQTLTVPLATLVRNVAPGDNVLFTGSVVDAARGTSGAVRGTTRTVQLVAHVTGYAEEVTRALSTTAAAGAASSPPDVFIPHTILTVLVTGDNDDVSALRPVLGTPQAGGISMRYGFRDVGTLIPTPAMTLDQLPATVYLPADLELPAGPVALQDTNGAGLLVTTAPADVAGSVTLEPADGEPGPLDSPLSAPIRLLVNLVAISRGTTVRNEILGDGDPTAASQAFVLQHSPLIYLPPTEPGGAPVSTLSVSVDQVPWVEVRAFAGQAPDATVYVVSELPDGSIQVRFGDGINGARLPLGVGNVIATYRYGSPAPSPPASQLATVLQPQPNLGTVSNPVDITPGTAPESAAQTAEAAPATVVLLSAAASDARPLISLDDCERLAATVSGVTRARAYWTWDPERQRPGIAVYVDSETRTDAADVADAVINEPPLGLPSRVPLRADPAHGVGLVVSCQLLCSPGANLDAIKKAATEALIGGDGLFGARNMAIGQRLYRSQVEAALMVGGVIAVLDLRVHRSGPGDGLAETDPDEVILDPGQDGYFSLPSTGLTIGAVTR